MEINPIDRKLSLKGERCPQNVDVLAK